jgi:hypothetical protein
MARRGVVLLVALLAAAPLAGSRSAAEEVRNEIAPYRFQPPSQPSDALEQQKALIYRNQLDAQRLQLERNQTLQGFTLDRQRQIGDTNRELDRIDRILQP